MPGTQLQPHPKWSTVVHWLQAENYCQAGFGLLPLFPTCQAHRWLAASNAVLDPLHLYHLSEWHCHSFCCSGRKHSWFLLFPQLHIHSIHHQELLIPLSKCIPNMTAFQPPWSKPKLPFTIGCLNTIAAFFVMNLLCRKMGGEVGGEEVMLGSEQCISQRLDAYWQFLSALFPLRNQTLLSERILSDLSWLLIKNLWTMVQVCHFPGCTVAFFFYVLMNTWLNPETV